MAIKNQNPKSPRHITPASQLEIRPAPEMVSSGIPAIDTLTGGLPRGCLTEICGPASSGRTTLLLAALAAATRRGEFCVVVDASDALDPHSAAAAGVELESPAVGPLQRRLPPKNPAQNRKVAEVVRARNRLTPEPILSLSNGGIMRPEPRSCSSAIARDNPTIVWNKSCAPPIYCSKAEASA